MGTARFAICNPRDRHVVLGFREDLQARANVRQLVNFNRELASRYEQRRFSQRLFQRFVG